MISAHALTRYYGDVIAVDDVSFKIGSREIVGLLGHNGAGKTTIMKMITGYLEPSSGHISINGADVWSDRRTAQRQIGYLPENCPLYPEMTVLDYLDFAAAMRSVPESQRCDRIGYAIQKTNLAGVAEQSISTLSRGYKQRLGVAQAIIHSPSILILDEPTNGLDPSQILEMRSLIKELAETATVVVSTHILQEVQVVCGRVIIINNGKLALDAEISDIQRTGQLRLVTDAEPDRCATILGSIPGLRLIPNERKGEQFYYTAAAESADLPRTAAVLARTLVEHGCNVYALHPLMQDLETIFTEITAGKRITDEPNGSRKNRSNHVQEPVAPVAAGGAEERDGRHDFTTTVQEDSALDE